MAEPGYDLVPTSGSNPAIGFTTIKPNPTAEYIYTGPGRSTPGIPQLLTQEIDDVTRAFGFKTYEAMLTDPAVQSQYLGLKLSMLTGPARVVPTVRPKGYRAGQATPVDKTTKLSPTEQKAVEAAEFCERENKRFGDYLKVILLQLLDMMAFGHKLAEKTREECKYGPDKGKLCLKSVKVKPSWAWKFVVDATMKPVGILTYIPPSVSGGPSAGNVGINGGYTIIPVDKFVLATWLPRDNDPRGTSALRTAYDWWNLKRQIMPFYYQHLRRFGSPSLDGVMAPNDTGFQYPLDPTTGLELITQAKVSSSQRFVQTLIAFQNNSILVRPAGSELNVLEPKSNGEAFLQAFDLFDRQICLAIGLQVRASLEAKHGSKADSETAQDREGLVVAWGREVLGDLVSRHIYYESIKLNMGEDIAEEFTPSLMVGKTEQQDKASMWGAASSAGWSVGPSQFEELDIMLEAPERDQEEDQKHADEQAQQAADLAAKSKGPNAPLPGGQGGKKPAGKPAAKPAKPAPK